MSLPTLQELLKAGVHFGHRTMRWHPKMAPYLFGIRKTVHIIDLEKTREQLEKACAAATAFAKEGKVILFVGTKDSAKQIVREAAERAGMPCVVGRWLGGTITNFEEIAKLIEKYRTLVRSRDTGELVEKYTKFEQAEHLREIARLEHLVGGMAEIRKLPDALFIIDLRHERTAVREVQRKGLITFGICDSNVDPTSVTYAIPGNDDALSSLRVLVDAFSDAVAEGVEAHARSVVAASGDSSGSSPESGDGPEGQGASVVQDDSEKVADAESPREQETKKTGTTEPQSASDVREVAVAAPREVVVA
jgi:small subunit ribosomal protein S2